MPVTSPEESRLIVGWLLANQRSDYTRNAAELNMEQEVDGFSFDPADHEGNLARGLDRDMDEPRLFGWSEKGKLCFRHRGKDVHQEIGGKSVRDVGWKIEMILSQLSSSLRDVICPVDALMSISIGFGNEGPR